MRRIALGKGEKRFMKNLWGFTGGRTVAVVITLLLTPVIARLFTPAHFGAAALLLAISTSVGPLSAASYDRAVQVARTADEASRLLALCFWIVAVVSVLSVPVLMLLGMLGVWTETIQGWGLLILLLPVGIASEGGITSINAWLLRHQRYKAIVAGEIAQTSTRSAFRIGAGYWLGSSVWALVFSYVVAYWTKFSILLYTCRKFAPLPVFREINAKPREIVAVGREYGDFPKYNLPTGILMQVTGQLPIFVFASTFGPEVAGFFAMADRITRVPIHVITNTMRQITLQRFANIWNDGRSIRRPLIRTSLAMMAIVLIPAAITWTSGEELLTLALGKKWQMAGRFVEIMAPSFVVLFVSATYNSAMAAMRRQRVWFWIQLALGVSRLSILPIAAMRGATAELVLQVYVWSTVATSVVGMIVVQFSVPKEHPGFKTESGADAVD